MIQNIKTLASLLLLCPTLYSMQNPHDINQALIIAAGTHNASAYRQAAREAITYAESHPQNIDELSPGIHLNTLTPDFSGHSASLAYGIATNNPVHVAMSSASALVSALTLQQNRTENQNDWGTIARSLTFSLNGLPLGFAIGDAIAHRSWQRMIPTLISYGIHFIPFIREESITGQRNRLAEKLGKIDNDYLNYLLPTDIQIGSILIRGQRIVVVDLSNWDYEAVERTSTVHSQPNDTSTL